MPNKIDGNDGKDVKGKGLGARRSMVFKCPTHGCFDQLSQDEEVFVIGLVSTYICTLKKYVKKQTPPYHGAGILSYESLRTKVSLL